jgi:hypothetical protein
VFKGTATTGNLNYLLAWDSANSYMRFLIDTAAGQRLTAGSLAKSPWPKDGAWRLVAGVYDGAVIRLYVNGVELDATAAPTIAGTDSPLTVSDPNALSNSMEGDVDEIAIWNKALTTAQIQSLYAIGHR